MTRLVRLAHSDLGQHACCFLVQAGDNAVQCGLWCGHDEDHVPFVPGGYLPEQLLGPLQLPPPIRRVRFGPAVGMFVLCPMCAGPLSAWDCEGPGRVARADGDGWRSELELQWSFDPCGCRGREIVEEQR